MISSDVCAFEDHFTGKERDSESGNDYFGARYYGSSMGRFMSPDPSGLEYADPKNPQSLNLYSYVLNNPLHYIDPTGLVLCDWGSSDQGGEDYDDDADCAADGGTVVTDNTTVKVNGNNSGDSLETEQDGTDSTFIQYQSFSGQAQNNVSKHYGTTIPCTSSAADVMNFVQTSFGTFGDYSRWGGEESVTFSPPSGMGSGSTIPISIGTFGIFQTLSVTVASINSQSMTFTTNPGHLLYPASITFSATPAAQDAINFNIDLGGTVANPFEFYLGGGNFEDAQWNHFLGQVGSYCEQQ